MLTISGKKIQFLVSFEVHTNIFIIMHIFLFSLDRSSMLIFKINSVNKLADRKVKAKRVLTLRNGYSKKSNLDLIFIMWGHSTNFFGH